MSLNRIILIGNLAHDPELRYTASGVAQGHCTIAVDRPTGKDKEKETDWIPLTAWRETAEFLNRNGAKGRLVAVEGRLQIRKWKDSEGQPRKTAEVVVDNVKFLDSRRENSAEDSFEDSDGT
jgi:single-strand DNA-binding protein